MNVDLEVVSVTEGPGPAFRTGGAVLTGGVGRFCSSSKVSETTGFLTSGMICSFFSATGTSKTTSGVLFCVATGCISTLVGCKTEGAGSSTLAGAFSTTSVLTASVSVTSSLGGRTFLFTLPTRSVFVPEIPLTVIPAPDIS
jgi:hypothetical protein